MTTVASHSILPFEEIALRVLAYNARADLGLLERAYRLAEVAHDGSRISPTRWRWWRS